MATLKGVSLTVQFLLSWHRRPRLAKLHDSSHRLQLPTQDTFSVHPAIRALVLLTVVTATGRGQAAAQPVPTAPEARASEAETPSSPSITEVQPELLYLRDKNRTLIALPGFTLEQFMELYRLKDGLQPPVAKPRFSLPRLQAEGIVTGTQVRLKMTLDIVLHQEGWSLIPLQLGKAVLQDDVQYLGEGQQFLQFDAEEERYASWIQGEADSEHQLIFNVLVPLSTISGQSRLELDPPQAATSQLVIQVPDRPIRATSEGASPPTVTEASEGGSRIQVLGLKGKVALSWKKADARAADIPVLLESSSTIYARMDGRSTNCEATLTVRSLGAAFDQFRVKLPPGAQWIGGQQAGYAVTSETGSEYLTIKLDKKEVGPVKIKLVTEQSYDVTRTDQWIELAGFQVEGAVRQWGHIAVSVVGDWRLIWGKRSRVRQVDELPEPLQRKDVLAGFEFLGQPSSLKVRVVARIPRVSVEPEYLLLVNPDNVQLNAAWNYRIRGGKIYSVAINVGDWEIEEIGPPALVDANGWTQDGSVLTVPLLQPATGSASLSFIARRKADPDSGRLSFTLPAPQADVVGQATATIAPADNVDLLPRLDELVGMTRQSTPVQRQLTDRRREPISYWADVATARFSADYRLLRQQITIDVQNRVDISPDATRIEQQLRYQVLHEPLYRILLRLPESLAASGQPQFILDGQAVQPTLLDPTGEEDTAGLPVSIEIAAGRVGATQLVVRYDVPPAELLPEATASASIPFVVPDQGEVREFRATVQTSAGLAAELADGDWRETASTGTLNASPALSLTAADPQDRLQLALHLDERQSTASTVIDKAWVQTWLSSTARRDRAVFLFSTSAADVRLQMPSGLAPDQLEVLLNASRIIPQFEDSGKLIVPLGQQPAWQPNILELRYYFPDRDPPGVELDLEIPWFGDEAWVRHSYWQLVLPREEHLLLAPAALNREFVWDWHGFFWRRTSSMDETALESWSGGTAESTLPQTTNQYLFSSIEPVTSVQLRTAGRAQLVFLASLVVLTLGLLLLYAPVLRRPPVLFMVSIGLLALAATFPDQAMLIAQASVLGVLLSLVAICMHQIVSRRQRRGVVVRSGPSSIIERSSIQPYYNTSAASKPSTRTVSVALPSAENP